MKHYLIIACITVCLLLSRCSKPEFETFILPPSTVESAKEVFVIDTIYLPDSRNRKTSVSVLSDTLLIIENDDHGLSHGEDMYYLYSPIRKHRTPLLQFGNSSKGLLSSTTCRNGETFLIYDFIKGNIYQYNINNLLCGVLTPRINSISFPTQYLLPYKDTSFIFLNPYYFPTDSRQWKKYKGRFCISTGGSYHFNYSYKYDPYDVTRGVFILSQDKDRIVYFDSHLNCIEFYDSSLNPIKKIVGPSSDDVRYGAITTNEHVQSIVFSGAAPETYLEVTYNDDFIYAAYSGKTIVADSNRSTFNSLIFVFSWDGEWLETRTCDLHIKTLSPSSENARTIYIFGQDDIAHYSLLKCHL